MVEIQVRGDGAELSLRLDRWEFPDEPDPDDRQWIVARAELVCGTFAARQPVTLRRTELAAFAREVEALVATLSGTADLDHIEQEVGVTVELKRGSGVASLFVARHGDPDARLEVGMPVDQSYLRDTLRQLRAALAEFPAP